MDFRARAAEATLDTLRTSGSASVADLDVSGCVVVPGGRHVHYLIELPCVALSLLCLMGAVGAVPLTWLGVLPSAWTVPVLGVGLAVMLVMRKVKSMILRTCLRWRNGSLLKGFANLPRRDVTLEEGRTHRRTKLVPEDEGVCLLDAGRQRILVEGCSYRYAIRGRDVRSVEPVSGYALSGARIRCTMAGHDFDVVLMTAGQGPLASLVHSFAPSAEAEGLANGLKTVLLGPPSAARPAVVPPPLPPRD